MSDQGARLHTVKFIKDQIEVIEGSRRRIKKDYNEKDKELLSRYQSYRKLLQEACPHLESKRVSDFNFHKNEDDSYDECIVCGKHL